MAQDPLEALARLRRLEVLAAQRRLAEARASLTAERDSAAAAEAQLRREDPAAAPATYGAFLAHRLAAREAQAAAIARAEALVEAERARLAEARREEVSLATLRDRRAMLARRQAERRAERRLDEARARIEG